jgi:hypothetical protein
MRAPVSVTRSVIHRQFSQYIAAERVRIERKVDCPASGPVVTICR